MSFDPILFTRFLQPLLFVKIGMSVLLIFLAIFAFILFIQIRRLNGIFMQQFASTLLAFIAVSIVILATSLFVYTVVIL